MFYSTSVSAVISVIYLLVVYNNTAFAQENTACTRSTGEAGTCLPIRGCQPILDLLQNAPKPLTASMVYYIKAQHCGFDGNGPRVCCEISKTTTKLDSETTPTMGPVITTRPNPSVNNPSSDIRPEDVSNHANIKLLPVDICGPILTQKLSGGNKTELFEYPWMALLQYETRNGLKFLCAGSLINERYILTAAHCVVRRLVSIRLGEHNLDTDVDCQNTAFEDVCAEPAQDIPISEIIIHPEYNKPRWANNDVAIVRLSRSADMTPESVRPICLPVSSTVQNILPKRVSISGWGTTENQHQSRELLQASLPIVPNNVCQEFFKRSVQIRATQMCAGGETGVDSCKGDSGGPLVYPAHVRGTQMVQFGIISIGIDVCSKTNKFPGIYTRVSHYMKWILDNMRT